MVRLAKDDLTKAQIAERLFISPRTVQTHLNRVFGKRSASVRAPSWPRSRPAAVSDLTERSSEGEDSA